MFKRKALLLLLLFSALPITAAQATPVPYSFSFHGAGYGHGVGMSQIGARGMALESATAERILNYYYQGATVETTTDLIELRVNVGHLLKSATIKSDTASSEILLFSALDTVTPLARILPGTQLAISLNGNALRFLAPNLDLTGSKFILRWSGTRYLAGAPSSIFLGIEKSFTRYRYGQLNFTAVRSGKISNIEITNSLNLHDEYLYGIGEMPTSWPAAALQAQVIASRTYALSKAGKIRAICDCDLYATSLDQAFIGYAKEAEPRYGTLWRSAVDSTTVDSATARAIFYNGKPISAFFFSSSNGFTEAAANVFGTAFPYLNSVPDAWSASAVLNKRYVDWTRSITQKAVAAAFLLPDVQRLRIISESPTGTVTKIQGISSTGKKVTIKGETFRSRCKLPSAWFELL
jgi:SpoIID/LytB domain protein